MNLFKVNAENMAIIAKMLKRDGFGIPSSRSFGSLVKSFNLELVIKEVQKISGWRLAIDRIASFIL